MNYTNTFVNWTSFFTDFNAFWMHPYTQFFGDFFLPLILATIIGLTYVISKNNLIVTIYVAMLSFACFGGVAMMNHPTYNLFFGLITILGIAGFFTTFFLNYRRMV